MIMIKIAQLSCGTEYSGVQKEIEKGRFIVFLAHRDKQLKTRI